MAVVDHYRKNDVFLKIHGYKEKIKEVFGKGNERTFVQNLRNYSVHSKISKANRNVTYHFGNGGTDITFLLDKNELLKWNGWSINMREHIEQSKSGIDVENFFKDYLDKANSLSKWYKNRILDQYIDDYSKYLHYKNMIEGIKQYYSLNLSVGTLANREEKDPYQYFDRYLTKKQADVINALPRHSVEQVEKLISFVDVYSLCDDAFRKNLYKLFSIDKN